MEAPKCQTQFVKRVKILSSYLIVAGAVVLGTGFYIDYVPMIIFGTLFLGLGIGSLSVQLVLKHRDFKPILPEEEETPVVVEEQVPDSVVVEEKPVAEPTTIEIFDENGKDKEVKQ